MEEAAYNLKRQNIVVLVNDHQAYYGHGRSGGPVPMRPNFDRLAAEGISFERSYTCVPLCGPARRTMVTGLFPHNHKNHFNYSDAPYDHDVYLKRLSDAGYRNFHFGKWHAGPGTSLDHGCQGLSLPNYGNPYVTEEYRQYCKRRGLPEAVHYIDGYLTSKEFDEQFPSLRPGIEYKCDSFWCGENAYGRTLTPRETHESFFLANLACEALTDLANTPDDRPFTLRVDFWGPHQPHLPTQEFLDLYRPEEIPEYPSFSHPPENKPEFYRHGLKPLAGDDGKMIYPSVWPWSQWQQILARCYAHITMVDAAGGLILDKLEELGLAENTIVIWTTDHGDAMASHGGMWDKGSYMTEEVMRVPLAIRFPGRIAPGQVSEKLVSNIDLVPTIMDAAGLEFGNPVDGRSLLPLCTGVATDWREDLMCETAGHGYTSFVAARMIVAGEFKYIANQGHIHELYDLKNDPYELENLIQNPAYAGVLEDLKARLRSWQEGTCDPDTVIEA